MRTKYYRIFLFVFVIYLPNINICTGQNAKMFEMAYSKTEIISINEKYTNSILIHPFKVKEAIFSLSVNARVILNSNKSLIRVIFISENGEEYLVLESNYMISEQNQIEYNDYGEETAILNGVIPGSIKIEIEDASILLETISYNNANTNKLVNKDFLSRSKKVKINQESVKIDILNKQIKKNGYLWTAGETPVSQMTYQQKKKLFGGTLPNLKGFEYYKGGIYNFTDPTVSKKALTSNIVSSFDWRNRHGQDWMTSIKNQESEVSCWAYGAMSSLEAIINLYYNKHINMDLSEQAFVSCMWGIYRTDAVQGWSAPPCPQCAINSPSSVFCMVKNIGAVDENAYPNSNVYDALGLDENHQPCTTAPPNGCSICSNLSPDYLQRLWKVNEFKELDPPKYYYPVNTWCEQITEDSLKVNIVRNGPVAFLYPLWSHVMCFVGFGVIKQGDMLSNYGIVDAGNALIGKVYWIAKNSWGTGWGDSGYCKLFLDLDQDVLASVAKTPITQPSSTHYNVVCTDSDGDGYCWWGIGKRPTNGCPVTPHLEEDGDDSDPLLGPYDANYNCTVLTGCPAGSIPPSAPAIGLITQPTCTQATGSVVLNGLPETGVWEIRISPGSTSATGTGTSTTIFGLTRQTYTFTVTNASDCKSENSANVVINAQHIPSDIEVSYLRNITFSSAVGGGNVASDGGSAIIARGVCWSTSQNPTVADNKTTDGSGTGNFTSHITGLSPNTAYYVRAYATNNVCTAYGSDQLSFRTYNYDAVSDIDANYYNIITIGAQVWMTENLRTTRYADNTGIPVVADNTAWAALVTPAYCWYNNDISLKDSYGAMYNWYAAGTGKLCPTGWRVPSDADWTVLTDYLINNGYGYGNTGNEVGKSMAAKSGWTTSSIPGTVGNDVAGNNRSGFSAIPEGDRSPSNGDFYILGHDGTWWSSTSYDLNNADYRGLSYNLSTVNNGYYNKKSGFSVRCVRDLIPTDVSTSTTSAIRIYPNPVKDILKIEYKDNNYETISILNPGGVLLEQKAVISPRQQIDFSKFKSGIYILEFAKYSGEKTRIKIIKP